jgi:internalin A
VRLNLWDFGGQDIYHGSHTLFLHGQAIFLLLWKQEEPVGNRQVDSYRPLTYWLDYLRAVAGPDNPLIVCQSQCDTPEIRADVPVSLSDWIGSPWTVEMSAKTDFGLGRLEGTLKDAASACLLKRPLPPIGKGRLRVRDRLRKMVANDQQLPSTKRRHRLIKRQAFDKLCTRIGGISDTEALLGFLHHNGVVFYRPGLFKNKVILDQNWALEAIYSIFHQDKCFKQLKKLHGRFSREDLKLLIWSDYTSAEQEAFLGMMESCGICFKVRELSDEEWEYVTPELLPEWPEAKTSLLAGRVPKDLPVAEAKVRYPFLQEGLLRSYLSKIGQEAGDSAIYWKYGCWSYEETTDSRVLIEGRWNDTERQAGAGTIRLRAWGKNAESLIDPLLEALESLPICQPPEIKRTKAIRAHAKKLKDLIFTKDPMKDFFISYTHTDKPWAEWIAWKLEEAGYSTVIDVWDFRPGANFVLEMQRAASTADHTIAVLSQKYLESSFTAPEWAAAFAQDPQGRKQKLIPIRIAPCELTGILAPINYLDLVGLPEEDARAALLGAFSARNKPSSAPGFPGVPTPHAPSGTEGPPQYPGISQATSPPLTESLAGLVENPDQNRMAFQLSVLQRLEFMRHLSALLPQHFNMLVGALSPEPGLIPDMPAPQADRATALVRWAERPGGCGLSVIQEILKTFQDPK